MIYSTAMYKKCTLFLSIERIMSIGFCSSVTVPTPGAARLSITYVRRAHPATSPAFMYRGTG
jgi:hypothetical protein